MLWLSYQMRALFVKLKLFWYLDAFEESHSQDNVQIAEVSE